MPARIFMMVDLPEPLGPIMPTLSPSSRLMAMPLKSVRDPMILLTCSACNNEPIDECLSSWEGYLSGDEGRILPAGCMIARMGRIVVLIALLVLASCSPAVRRVGPSVMPGVVEFRGVGAD